MFFIKAVVLHLLVMLIHTDSNNTILVHSLSACLPKSKLRLPLLKHCKYSRGFFSAAVSGFVGFLLSTIQPHPFTILITIDQFLILEVINGLRRFASQNEVFKVEGADWTQ